MRDERGARDEERLWRESGAGDAAAAAVLLAQARRRGDGAAEALGLLALAEPGERGWRQVCEALARARAEPPRALALAAPGLLEARWRGVERRAPPRWLETWEADATVRLALSWCTRVEVRGCADVATLRGLYAAVSWRGLGTLVLEACPCLGDAAALAEALGPWLSMPSLRELELRAVALGSGNGSRRDVLQALLGLSGVSGLRALALVECGLDAGDAVVLAGCAQLRGLQRLDLRDNDLGDAGLEALCGSAHLGALETLDASRNGVGDAGLAALAERSRLRGLRRLALAENVIGNDGAVALANAASVAALDELELEGNRLDVYGCNALSASRHLAPRLRQRAHDWEYRLDREELLQLLEDHYELPTEIALQDMARLDLVEQSACWEFELERRRADDHYQELRACETERRAQERALLESGALTGDWGWQMDAWYDELDRLEPELEDEDEAQREAVRRLGASSVERWRWWDDDAWLWRHAADVLLSDEQRIAADDGDDGPEDEGWLYEASRVWCERIERAHSR